MTAAVPPILDTPLRSAGRNPLRRYAARVDIDESKAAATERIRELAALEDAIKGKRAERDAAIARLHYQHGMRPTQLAKELGLTLSLVRLVLRAERPKS